MINQEVIVSEDLLEILEKQLTQRGYDKSNDVGLPFHTKNTVTKPEVPKNLTTSSSTQTVITKLSEINMYWQKKGKGISKKSRSSKHFANNSNNLISRYITYTGIDELRNMTEASTDKFRKQLLHGGLEERSVATYISSIKRYIRETSEELDVYMPDVGIALSSFDKDIPLNISQEQAVPFLLLTKDLKDRLRKLPISSTTLSVLFVMLYNYDLNTGRIRLLKREIADTVERHNETIRLKIRELERLGFISTIIRTDVGNTYILTEKFFTSLGLSCPKVSSNAPPKSAGSNLSEQKRTLFQKIRGLFTKFTK